MRGHCRRLTRVAAAGTTSEAEAGTDHGRWASRVVAGVMSVSGMTRCDLYGAR